MLEGVLSGQCSSPEHPSCSLVLVETLVPAREATAAPRSLAVARCWALPSFDFMFKAPGASCMWSRSNRYLFGECLEGH